MNFRFDKLTIKGQEAIQRAQSGAQAANHPEIDSLHLLASLLQEHDGIVAPIVQKIGTPVDQLMGILKAELERQPKVTGAGDVGLSAELQNVLQTATK